MQVVGYHSTPDPALILATDGAVEPVAIGAGTELTCGLGERRCAGVIQSESRRHISCDRPHAPRCPRHERHFDESTIRTRDTEHAVYLAAFAPATFKVGITRSERLETRLREQGADRGAHVFTVADGDIARDVEEDLGTELAQRVRVTTKLEGIGRSVDEAAWERLLDEYQPIDRFDLKYGFTLDATPVPESMATGSVIGVQGRVIVLARGETTYAVDMRDLVGYDLTEDVAERERQSSLGSFG